MELYFQIVELLYEKGLISEEEKIEIKTLLREVK